MLQPRAGGDLVQGPVSKSHSVLSLAGLMSESTNGLELHPLVTSLAEQIRTCRTALPDLSPLAVDPALEAIGMLDGETLFIRNELHQCLGLRKLHLEIARLGMGLQILHCVFFQIRGSTYPYLVPILLPAKRVFRRRSLISPLSAKPYQRR